MSMILHPLNEQAFRCAVQALEQQGRAAVLHPTGSGKSCIAWSVIQAHPEWNFFWLTAGPQRMELRKAELKWYHEGSLPENVRFCEGSALASATPEQWVQLGRQRPECIVLDSCHEFSAVCWAQSVQKLLRLCPQTRVLGLSVAETDKLCRAAEMLFQDCVVSRVTVAGAMAAGAMSVPGAYSALLWPQEPELNLLRARIKNLCLPKKDLSLRSQYEELCHAVQKVESPIVLLPRLMTDKSGWYLVLFETKAYQEEMEQHLIELLRYTDAKARFYHADNACYPDSVAVESFLADDMEGPKVLLCANEPGVQQELRGLSGVILVRQTSRMEAFLEMLCRGTVAAGGRSIPVFDLTNQFDGLGNGRQLQRECTEAMTRAGSQEPGFRQERPMQQSYRIYGRIRREMETRWEEMAAAAQEAGEREGTLELPRSYTLDGLAIGRWLEFQRQVQAGQRPGRLTPEQTARLEKMGVRWNRRLEAAWEKGYAAAQKYSQAHGDLLVPVRYRTRKDFALGEWIVYNRQRYLSGSLSRDRIERLENIGMVWNISNGLWEQNYAAAVQYYLEQGDLEMNIKYTTPAGFGLGVWLAAQRAAYKNGELSPEQIRQLEALQMDWTNRNDRKWMESYRVAQTYYQEHGDLDVPAEYITPEGELLGKWIARQRYAFQNPERSSARVTAERKALLDKLGMQWAKQDPWMERYELAAAYKKEHGCLDLTTAYKTEDNIWLGSWVARQRHRMAHGGGELSPQRKKLLKELFRGEKRAEAPAERTGSVREANWERNYRSARSYARSHKHLLVPASYVDKDGVRLGIWISNLRAARRQRPDSYQVIPAHIQKLDKIGMVWDARDAKWCSAYQQAAEYYAAHGDLKVSAGYKTGEQGFGLGDWLRRMRDWNASQDPKLTEERRRLLDEIGMEW